MTVKKPVARPSVPLDEPRVFRPVLDWWVAAGVVVLLLMLVASIPRVVWLSDGLTAMGVGAAVLLVLFIAYMVDVVFYSLYVLDKDQLVVVNHFRTAHVPYRDMAALQPGGVRSLVSFSNHKRFALSRKNVIIKLSRGQWRSISVSPERRDDFVRILLERIDAERSGRVARSRRTVTD